MKLTPDIQYVAWLQECKGLTESSVLCEWGLVYASTHYRKTHAIDEPWTEDTLNSLFTAFDQLGRFCILLVLHLVKFMFMKKS